MDNLPEKDYWYNRRLMAWASMAGLFFIGSPFSDVSDTVASALVLSFAGIIGNYTIQARIDDCDKRTNNR